MWGMVTLTARSAVGEAKAAEVELRASAAAKRALMLVAAAEAAAPAMPSEDAQTEFREASERRCRRR